MTTATDALYWRRLAEEREQALETLLTVARTLSSTLELGPLLQDILAQLRVVADYTGASINRVEGTDLVALAVHAHDGDHAALHGRRTPLRRLGMLWEHLRQGEPVVIADVRDALDPLAAAYRVAVGAAQPGAPVLRYRSTLLTPMIIKGETAGVIGMTQDDPDFYRQSHVELARAIASHAAIAIENARLYERAQEAAALEERARIARDLHDSVTQSVYGVRLMSHTAQALYAQHSDALGETLGRIDVIAQDALSELRALLYELTPSAEGEDGLARALARLVATMQVRTETPIRFAGDHDVHLGRETETAMVRIVQEALTNAIKYARATTLSVTLAEMGDQIVVTVVDDGIGFDPWAPVAASADGGRGGLGMRSMRERAAAAGCRLQVESAPGAGTRISVTVARPARRPARRAPPSPAPPAAPGR